MIPRAIRHQAGPGPPGRSWPGPTASARADSFRVKTERGTYLVEVDAPDVVVRGDGDDLVITRLKGDEVRLKLDVDRADRSAKDPVLTVRRDGKAIVTARRISSASAPASPFADGPGRTVLGSGSTWTAWGLAMTPDGKTLVSGPSELPEGLGPAHPHRAVQRPGR